MLNRLIAFLLMLWLPLQGMAMVAMPYCKHAAFDGDASAAVVAAHAHEHAAADSAGAHAGHDAQHDGASDTAAAACDQCELCHLACAGYVPAETRGSPPLADRAFWNTGHERFRSFYGELFDRPPLLARA